MAQEIAYQNKDIEFKILSETFKERSFAAYGLDLPRIREVLPTNLPVVAANEMRMDNLFLLEDGTYAIVDYESKNRKEDRIKYVNYIGRVLERFYREHGKVPRIRMIVIYTGDVRQAEHTFNTGCVNLELEQGFTANLPAEEIYETVKGKLARGEELTEQELMQLIILPLAEAGREKKQERVRQVVGLAKQIADEAEQKLVLSGLLVSSDKFIDKEDAEGIRREIYMTKVGQLLFEEGMEHGIKRGMERGIEQGMERGIEQGERRERLLAVRNLLKLRIPESQILEMYSRDDLKNARELLGDQEIPD